MKIKILNKSPFPKPEYQTKGSAGMDLQANINEPIVLYPLDRFPVPTGIFIELPEGYEAQIRPRSGMAASDGVTVINAPGTIDSDYRGEIKVILVNLSGSVVSIYPGERIAQMVIAKYERVDLELAQELDKTDRDKGGFGSTGK